MVRHKIVDGVVTPFTPEEEIARDIEEQAWVDGAVSRNASTEIQRLESTVTPRRLREALAGQPGKDWIAGTESAIAIERAKLNG